jgi:hypothetical protein
MTPSRAAAWRVVELTDGASFAFPPHLLPEPHGASEQHLDEVALLGAGSGLQWEALDAELCLPGLLAGLFGTRAALARHAGGVSSPAKTASARINGAEGGRPRTLP